MPDERCPNPEQIEALTLRYLDGELSQEEAESFADMLRADPRVMDWFVGLCYQDQLVNDYCAAALIDESIDDDDAIATSVLAGVIDREREARLVEAARRLAGERPEPARLKLFEAAKSTPRRQIVIPRWAFYGGIAAALLLALFLIDFTPNNGPTQPPVVSDATPALGDVVARLKRTVDARWEPVDGVLPADSARFREGERLRLAGGLVEMQMTGGARVVLQGPAEITVVSEKALRLHEGRLTSVVEERARGFQVQTASAVVVDLGTEFGVHVEPSGHLRADVFSGVVTLTPTRPDASDQTITMHAGQAAELDSAGRLVERLADDRPYVRDEEFVTRVRAAAGSAYDRWLAYGYELRRDPALVAHYVFDDQDEQADVLINHADRADAAGNGVFGDDGLYSAPQWSTGRFRQTRSLRFGIDEQGRNRVVFVPDSDALDLSGEMTLSVWMKPTQVSRAWNTLLSKRQIPPARLNFQFSIAAEWMTGDRRFQFGTGRDESGFPGFITTPGGPHRTDTEAWQLVTLVSDGSKARFYVNGDLIHTADQPLPPLINDAPLMIGSSPSELRPPIQGGPCPFNGLISEVAILSRAMSPAEVSDMYHAGVPEPDMQ